MARKLASICYKIRDRNTNRGTLLVCETEKKKIHEQPLFI